MQSENVQDKDVDATYERLKREAEEGGYHLNPDEEFTKGLVRGLLVNDKRYGYWNCPCRLASGSKEEDLDIICPCDYRDADIEEHGACYCALYVSTDVLEGKRKVGSIPERRPADRSQRHEMPRKSQAAFALSQPVWRCRVCGYLCARDGPPEICPVCKARKERFERFI